MAEWVFDRGLASQSRSGGSGGLEVFPKEIDYLVRETLQNAKDQGLDGSPVRVRYSLEEIRGADLDDFLRCLNWDQLRPHIESVAASADYVTFGPRLAEALEELDGQQALRVLRIEDTGTRGLVGGENDHTSNFNLLCRDDMISAGSRRQSGGSFGLGKSVLWLFSGLSTVLFSSGIEDDAAGVRERFFGRTLLPWHETGAQPWNGSGWYGQEEEVGPDRRAVSMFDDPARDAAGGCRLARTDGETGTSILVVGFDEPAREIEQDVPDICADIVASAARWFWPALEDLSMEVLVEGTVDGAVEFSQQALPTAEVTPFVLAQNEPANPEDSLDDPGDVVERDLEFEVPAQREVAGMIGDPLPATRGSVRLRVRLAGTDEEDHANTVALQRGTGMVVKYHEPFRRAPGETPFHAVLLAGNARGRTAADEAVEEFLRAAEPPAHSEWLANTDRMKAVYRRGAPGALGRLFTAVADSIRELTREEPGESTEGPDALRRLFPMPGLGAPPPRLPYRLSDAEASLDGLEWSFEGRFERREHRDEEWRFRVGLVLDQEGGRAQKAEVAGLDADAGRTDGPQPDGCFDVVVPARVDSVWFVGRTRPVVDLPDLHRVRVSLDVRALRGGIG